METVEKASYHSEYIDTKENPIQTLADMGLSVSDAIRLLLIRVADERCLAVWFDAINT